MNTTVVTPKPFVLTKIIKTSANDGRCQIVTETNINKNQTKLLKNSRVTENQGDFVNTLLAMTKPHKPNALWVDEVYDFVNVKHSVVVVDHVHTAPVMSVEEYINSEYFQKFDALSRSQKLSQIEIERITKLGYDFKKMAENLAYCLEALDALNEFVMAPKPCPFCGVLKVKTNSYANDCANEECISYGLTLAVDSTYGFKLLGHDEYRRTLGEVSPRNTYRLGTAGIITSFEVSWNGNSRANDEELDSAIQALQLVKILLRDICPQYIGREAHQNVRFDFDYA